MIVFLLVTLLLFSCTTTEYPSSDNVIVKEEPTEEKPAGKEEAEQEEPILEEEKPQPEEDRAHPEILYFSEIKKGATIDLESLSPPGIEVPEVIQISGAGDSEGTSLRLILPEISFDPHVLLIPTGKIESSETVSISLELPENPTIIEEKPPSPEESKISQLDNDNKIVVERAETEKPVKQAESVEMIQTQEEWKRKEIAAEIEKEFNITLPERGWIFTGERNRADDITLLSRETGKDSTDFTFKVNNPGEYSLLFQRQDLTRDINSYYEVALSAKEDLEPVLSMNNEGEGTERKETPDYSIADRLYREGRLEDALEEYNRNYREGNPEINNRIAEIFFSLGRYEEAKNYWEKNLEDEGYFKSAAYRGIIKTSIAMEDQRTFDSILHEFLKIEGIPVEEELKKAIEFQKRAGYYGTALNLLNYYIEKYPENDDLDWVFFNYGQIYEKSSQLRDIQKARNYYKKVTEEYPLSPYWSMARERLKYLERHFFQIR